MASDLQARAKEAFVDEDYDLAMDLLTKAIAFESNNAQYYADRAQANIKLNNLAEAVADANMAIELNPSLPKAYLRKGTACMKLKEYQTAKAALEMGASLAPGDSKFIDMLKQCHELIAEESDVTPIIPEKHTTTRGVSAKELEQVNDVSQQMTIAVAKPKYRHEFYQKPDEVVVTIFAKGIPRDSVTVDFGEQIIVPSRCRYEVLSTKMEIRLAKAEPIHWAALEFRGGATVPQRAIVSSVINVQRPTYPSSKPKRVDWDKLEAQVKKEEKDEKLDGDAALNKFFRQIYQDADEDTRRAMSKSFVESNGTVLSTNWKEVGSKKVQGSAPDGMELKKWEY
ncbi:protein SGT1 homolog B isoform X3 [Arachis ipaensis]|uniref:protein SGT1 homolog B isoform X3 n=1 Tax=Arachis ipaensis TaxID=130454 RepID=UPI000A2B1A7B|nr:protein SGT1 homolog B isoform X3 [Arachis ipaensis]XP_025679579.1 protein SGT1 homolog B isoform X3 [Arachis hypogaea]